MPRLSSHSILAFFAILPLTLAWNLPLDPTTTRRHIFATSAAGVTSALISSTAPAYADPKNALLPMGSGGIMMQPVIDPVPGWKPPPLATKLGASRISTISLSPLQQLSPFASQELYYPSFLFGEWNITSTLRQKIFPFGKDFVPSRSLMDGSPRNRSEQTGDSATYLARYFSTLADTPANQVTVNLGLGVPQPKVIADRAFNVKEMSRAYKQLAPVETVEWDYRKDPTRLTLQMESVTSHVDGRSMEPRKAEVYLTARQIEENFDPETGKPIYATSERSRTVTVGPGSVSANDQEVITEYRQIDDDHVKAVSRIAVYLTPNPNSREGVLWQQVQGKAVAFYDYEFVMTRNLEEFIQDGAKILRPCVKTPKDVIQCA